MNSKIIQQNKSHGKSTTFLLKTGTDQLIRQLDRTVIKFKCLNFFLSMNRAYSFVYGHFYNWYGVSLI